VRFVDAFCLASSSDYFHALNTPMNRFSLPVLLLLFAAPWPCAADPGVFNGWRGNGTGLWPDAHPPLEWQRVARGVAANIRVRADRPGDGDKPRAADMPLANGLVRDWLALGPISVKDSVQDFKTEPLADFATVQPRAGDTTGMFAWKTLTASLDDRYAFGPAGAPWADVAAAVGGGAPNQFVYAHTYLYSPLAGAVRARVDHLYGMKAWLNGKEIYSAAERRVSLGTYYGYSRVEFGTDSISPSAHFQLDLKPGWNRLLLRIGSFNRADGNWNKQSFSLRLMDLPEVAYKSKNIVWMAEWRTAATPHRLSPATGFSSCPSRTSSFAWTSKRARFFGAPRTAITRR
jgi:hypothetical protein